MLRLGLYPQAMEVLFLKDGKPRAVVKRPWRHHELIFGLKGRNYTDESWTEKAISEGYCWEVVDESADGPQSLMDNYSAILMWV